jgi:hypothetical protein
MLIHAQASILGNTCWYTQSLQCVNGHADTRAVINTGHQMQVHTRLLICCQHMHTLEALNTRKHTQVHSQLLIRASKCRSMTSSLHKQIHTKALNTCTDMIWCTPTHVHTCSALDTWLHMNMQTWLWSWLYANKCRYLFSWASIQAVTCSYIPSTWYIPTLAVAYQALETWRCMQMHADTRSSLCTC